jgi:L-lysine 2,3-aminomutase
MSQYPLTVIQSDMPEKWQKILSDLVTDPKELVQILGLDPTQAPAQDAIDEFPLKVPRPFVARMERGNWQDPLLLQVWPSMQEQQRHTDFVNDPLAEAAANPLPGLLHKYHGRVLLTAAPHCAIHCRYCFRRHFDYQHNSPSRRQWQHALDYIAADSTIEEVILSGGDPLAVADRQLRWLIEQLGEIPHLTTLRVHTRLPIVIPQRITPALIELLSQSRLRCTMVVHCNHARELDHTVAEAISKLASNGITLLNQSVLLADVNDNLLALTELSKALFSLHVLPYYLHLPDRVAGTRHFHVDAPRGVELVTQMRAGLPGYLVPRLVQEEPGAAGKTLLR